MTKRKSWADIQDEVCRMLQEEGRTLKYVMKMMAAPPWDFHASERSFRYQLKRWGATKSQLAALALPASKILPQSISQMPQPTNSDFDMRDMTSAAASANHPLLSFERSMDTLVPAFVPTDRSGSEGPSNFVVYEQIYDAVESRQELAARRLLRSARFSEGLSNVLHVAAREESKSCLDLIAKWVGENHNIDMRDSNGRTALEIAIRANKTANVIALLQWGSKVLLKNANGQQPLHVAVLDGACFEIHEALLRKGASINTSLSPTEAWPTPANLIFDRLKHAHTEAGALNWFQVLRRLLPRPNLRLHKIEECAQITFCKFTELWLESHDRERLFSVARPSMFHLLRKGADPNEIFMTLGGCCRSLAAVAFFHSHDNALAELVIDNSDMEKYGPDLFSCLLKSSSSDLHKAGGHSAEPHLESILKRGVHLPPDQHAICRILEESHVEVKLCLLRKIIANRPCVLQQLDTDPFRAITALSSTPSDCKYALAELLLNHQQQDDEQPTKFARLAWWSWSTFFSLEPLKAPLLSRMLLSHLFDIYGIWMDFLPQHLVSFAQCIMHVMTKGLIDNLMDCPLSLSHADRVNIALQLRKQYGLPHIQVDNDLILQVLASVPTGMLHRSSFNF